MTSRNPLVGDEVAPAEADAAAAFEHDLATLYAARLANQPRPVTARTPAPRPERFVPAPLPAGVPRVSQRLSNRVPGTSF